ncbi:MAG: response regulator transcription factor [Bacilli bacterium]|nr:response regulator transcription factor [Bacilli bacterium]
MNRKYQILIVEDQAMPAQLFEQLIKTNSEYNVVATVSCAAYALNYCVRSKVDLILMDVVTENGISGLDVSEKIKEKFKDIKIIIVTSMPECSYLARAKKIGIEGFWYKEISETSILEVIHKVLQGEIVYPLKTQVVKLGLATSDELTSRELEVLREVTAGYSNEEISKILYISLNTVRNHIAHLLEKTGFKNRVELAVRAREIGLVIKSRTENDL